MKKKTLRILALFLLAVILASGTSLLLSARMLSVSRYERTVPALTAPLRVVLLTDLHNSEFGEGNARLISLVAEEKPDLILLAGDLLNQTEERTDIAVSLIRELSAVAPVYVSLGNHEVQHEKNFGSELRPTLAEAGATVLEYNWLDVEIKGQALRIGGLYGYCLPGKYLKTGETRESECAFLEEFQDTERTKLLLCHMPVCWMINGSLDAWNVDLVFSGHAHGGQMRFPWIGGLYAPDQGWFPGRCEGLYESKDGSRCLVLSRGLGSSGKKLPRFNNLPEVLVLDLLPPEARS